MVHGEQGQKPKKKQRDKRKLRPPACASHELPMRILARSHVRLSLLTVPSPLEARNEETHQSQTRCERKEGAKPVGEGLETQDDDPVNLFFCFSLFPFSGSPGFSIPEVSCFGGSEQEWR